MGDGDAAARGDHGDHGDHGDLGGLVGLAAGRVADLIAAFAARSWTVAAAESLTAGLLTAVLTEVPGSSDVVRGGIVCYATDLKADLVGVDAALLARVGPVDPEVARQLAVGVRRRCSATIGVGLTGVAGPASQGGKEPGTVFVGLSSPAGDDAHRLAGVAPGAGRFAIRAAAVRLAIGRLEELVAG